MKTIITMLFAATSALFAAETNSLAPTLVTNTTPVLQVPIAEQAELVRQIGEEAAKGFDAETHARSLRAQIEVLLSKSAPAKPDAKADAVEKGAPVPDPATKAPAITIPEVAIATTNATSCDPVALKEVIRILRAEADRLEGHREKLARKP